MAVTDAADPSAALRVGWRRRIPISEVEFGDLERGILAERFRRGDAAIVVRCGEALRRLWSQLLENQAERLPWESPLLDLARNHHGGGDIRTSLGDVFYFQPGRHGYIARKLEITRPDGGAPAVTPSAFRQGGSVFEVDPDSILGSCRIVDRIIDAMLTPDRRAPDYKVTVQRLKYQKEFADYEGLARLTSSSLGRWGRFGFAIDASREGLPTQLRGKGVGMAGSLLMQWPPSRGLMERFSSRLAGSDRLRGTAAGERIIEGPHTDARLFTGLCGDRTDVRTEIFHDGRWRELEVGLDSIAVFPGWLAVKAFGLTPTPHRVLYAKAAHPCEAVGRNANVTLLLGAV